MTTIEVTPVTSTEPINSTSSSVPGTYATEGELDAALAAEQQRLDQLAEQQRVRSKRENLERLRAECSRLQILNDQPNTSPVSSSSIASAATTQVSNVVSSVMSTNVTSNALRNMRHVQDSVDCLMSKNGLAVKSKKSSEKPRRRQQVESSSGSDDDTDSSSDESSRERSKSKRRHKSGKSKKLTSNVPFPQRWPETYLKLHYVGKPKDHESLSIAEFCAGFTTILQRTKCTIEKEARINLLRDLMYFATIYPWSNVLAFHGACIMEIEQGILKWGSDFHHLIHTTLLMPSRSSSRSTGGRTGRGAASSAGGISSGSGAVRFCPKYQRNQCNFDRDHDGMFRNQNCHLRHICAKCWLENKSFAAHPESSPTCPLSVASTPAAAADADAEG